jgi:hypothetical protein
MEMEMVGEGVKEKINSIFVQHTKRASIGSSFVFILTERYIIPFPSF